jgi:MerR family transcriptional regulator, light-induced transcriptional regulator
MQYFNIQVASQLSGVATATIRAWEKRYNAVVPERAENKHRLYSEKDIEKLALLFKLTEYGQSIGKIAHLELAELKEIYATLLHRPYDERNLVSPHHEKVDLPKILLNFQLALSAYKLDIISHELDKAKTMLAPREICLNLFVPLFQEIGRKVDAGEISVAQEHTLSALFSFHMGQLIGMHYQQQNLREELILITTPEGEHHQLAILAASLLCIHHNFRFVYLSADLPAHSLAEAANALKPKYILLGVTKGHQLKEQLTLSDYLDELWEKLEARAKIWVGGNLLPQQRQALEKNNVTFFPSLAVLDQHLQDKA